MKNLALVASLVLLASCGSGDPAPEATASTDATLPMDAAATPAVAESVAPGSYDVTNPDGTKSVDTLMADGTFVSRDTADKVIDKGTWSVKDGKTCFISEGKAEQCYSESARSADGSFTATGADGKVTQVKPHTKM